MKKILILLSLLATVSGCSGLKEDIENSYGKAVEEAADVADTVKETKAKAEETISDINKAVDELGETKDAIEEVTK